MRRPRSLDRPALLRSLAGGYRRADLVADVLAGCLVGVVAVPLAIAFAIASGAPPIAGLVTGVVAGAIISGLGGSRFQIGGPTGAFVGLCATIVASHGYAGLILATLMGGVLLVGLGLLRLGSVVRLIPIPVVVGFTSGIAVIIVSTQLREIMGLREWPAEAPAYVHQRLIALWEHRASWNPHSPLVAAVVVATTLAFRRWLPRWPGALIGIVLATLAAHLAGSTVETVGDRYGTLPVGFPAPSLGFLEELGIDGIGSALDAVRRLAGPALAIGLLAAIESLLSATVADGMGGDRHRSDTELVAQGVANLASPLFGGLPATGAIARTATNIRSGARTPIAGLVHAAVLLLVVLVAGPLVAAIPLAALAGVLLVVAWYMAELGRWPAILRAGRGDAFLLPLAFALTVFVDLTVAVEVGVVLGMLFFVRRMAATVRIRSWSASPEGDEEPPAAPDHSDAVDVVEIEGPFFFGMAAELHELTDGLRPQRRWVALEVSAVPLVDATAAAALRELIIACHRRGATVFCCGARPECRRDLERHGILDLLGRERVLPDLPAVFAITTGCDEADAVRLTDR